MSFKGNSAEKIIIGIDHGYGNIKTANCCFKAGVSAYDKEPTFTGNMLVYNGRYYLIGEEHKEFTADKMLDMDYYVLTLAAVANELRYRKTTSARVHIAAGLPISWMMAQREEFKQYLLQNKTADFTFRGVEYHVEFEDASVFPQGFAAAADKLQGFKGINMLADIGNGTMNIMYIIDGKPQGKLCFTEKFGTQQCVLAARSHLLTLYGSVVDESVIEKVIRYGTAEISERYLEAIREVAVEYVDGIFRKLREHEYDPESMRLYVVGGGGCLIRNFWQFDSKRVVVVEDICATAKGYEYLAELMTQKSGGAA